MRRSPTLLSALLAFAPAALSPAASAQSYFDAPLFFAESGIGAIRALADVDLDNDEDLIWIDTFRVQTYLNDGTGAFTPGPVLNSAVQLLQGWPSPVVHPQVGDVDGDGRPDLVVAVDDPYPNAVVRVLRGLPGGAFAPAITIDLSGPPPGTIFGGTIQDVVLGQIDADPALEIAEAHSMSTGAFLADPSVGGDLVGLERLRLRAVDAGDARRRVGDRHRVRAGAARLRSGRR